MLSSPPEGSTMINITPGLQFLNIRNPFTNEMISVNLDKKSRTITLLNKLATCLKAWL